MQMVHRCDLCPESRHTNGGRAEKLVRRRIEARVKRNNRIVGTQTDCHGTDRTVRLRFETWV